MGPKFDYRIKAKTKNEFYKIQTKQNRDLTRGSLKGSDYYVARACEPYPDAYSYGMGQ